MSLRGRLGAPVLPWTQRLAQHQYQMPAALSSRRDELLCQGMLLVLSRTRLNPGMRILFALLPDYEQIKRVENMKTIP